MKGANIAGNYILTVAKNWIFDGIKTCDDVQERMLELDRNSSDVQLVLKALGLRRKATEEEYRLYLNWKNELGVEHENIMHLARKVKAKGAGFSKLDGYVAKCYALKLESKKEIDDYFNNLDSMFELAKSTCRAMGLRYDNLETVVDNYIAPWVSLGFEADAIIKIANFCFRYSVRTLEGLHGKINQMYRQGLLTVDSIDEYIQDLAKNDDNIIKILQKLGIDRNVSSSDRSMYNIWINTWHIQDDLLEFAIEKSIGMNMPMQYLNKLLSSFYSKKITTIEEAEKLITERKSFNYEKNEKSKAPEKAKGKEYSKDELNSLINNLFEVEI